MPQKPSQPHPTRSARTLVFGLVAVIAVLGLGLVILLLGQQNAAAGPEPGDALANSNESCVLCHRGVSPGIVHQYGHSSMATAGVQCADCHQVEEGYPGAIQHQGQSFYVLPSPSTAMCADCHQQEVAQFNASRHGIPAYVAVAGSKDLHETVLAAYQAIPEGSFAPDKSRNAIAELEGPEITKFACATCQDIGKPAPANSIVQCQKCHLTHECRLEPALKPET